MFAGNDEDDLFNPSASSNLANLFGTAMTFKNENANLSYIAPKQPKSEIQEPISRPNLQSTVICSKFINAFKQVDREYIAQGKCGIAIIGNQTLNVYELIIYKSKHEVISRTKLKKEFIFQIQNNNFATFIDDQQQQWSIHFEQNELNHFISELESQNVEVSHTKQNKPSLDNSHENDSSDTSTAKANILSRMAKMGQAILPNSPKTVDSESDDTDQMLKRTKKKQKHVIPHMDQPTNLPISQSEYLLTNNRSLPNALTQPNIPNFNPINQLMQFSHTPDMFNIYVAESRTHNCEMRMNITHLSSKLDKVIEEISKNKPTTNLERSEKLEYYENLIKNHAEELSQLQQKNAEYKDKMDSQELLITKLKGAVTDQKELQAIVDEQKETIKNYELKSTEQQTQVNVLSEFYTKYKDLTNLNEDNANLRSKLEDYNKKHELFSKKLKQNMNALYKFLKDSFNDDNTYSAAQIQEILATNLRTATINIIQEFSNNFDLNESNNT